MTCPSTCSTTARPSNGLNATGLWNATSSASVSTMAGRSRDSTAARKELTCMARTLLDPRPPSGGRWAPSRSAWAKTASSAGRLPWMSYTSASIALHGPTLTLRLPAPEDAQALIELAGDPEVTRWFSWGPYTSLDQAATYIERLPGQRERERGADVAQELRRLLRVVEDAGDEDHRQEDDVHVRRRRVEVRDDVRPRDAERGEAHDAGDGEHHELDPTLRPPDPEEHAPGDDHERDLDRRVRHRVRGDP